MLSQFSVHSYRSYRSQALISMQPANIDEHAAALRDPRKTGRPLLPVRKRKKQFIIGFPHPTNCHLTAACSSLRRL